MPPMTVSLAAIVFSAGAVAGALGIVLGIGGGLFLVPFFTLVLGFSVKSAAAISLTTVIATSSAVAAARAGNRVMNLRFGMLLEVATAAGSLLGGITAQVVAESTLQRMFGLVAMFVAAVMLARMNRRNVISDPHADPGRLGNRFYDAESGCARDVPDQEAPAGVVRFLHCGQSLVTAWHRRRGDQGAGPERVVWHAASRGSRDQRNDDRRDRHGRRDHLLRPRRPAATRRCARGSRCSVRFVGGAAGRRACVGEVVEAAHGDDPHHRRGVDAHAEHAVKPDDRGLSALEVTIGRVLRLGVGASSMLLAAGLLLSLVG